MILRLIRAQKKQNGRCCPRCGSFRVRFWKKNIDGRRFYYCPECRKHHKNHYYNDYTGTGLEKLKIPVSKIGLLAHYFCSNSSALQAYRTMKKMNYSISYQTVWKVFHIFRQGILKKHRTEEIKHDCWQIDEVYLGLKRMANFGKITKKQMRRGGLKAGRGSEGQTCVLTMISSFPPFQVRFKPIKNISREVFEKAILGEIGAKNMLRIDTDTFRSYNFLKEYSRHKRVKHQRGQFQNPFTGAHTNYAESWHGLVRWNMNRYRMISEEYLENYLAEFAWKAGFQKNEKDLLRLCAG